MRPTNPPVVATWMLEHLTFGAKNESLAGDLLEEFTQGRSVSWYGRQVIVAIALGCVREFRFNWPMAVFAALWTLLAPIFGFYVVRLVLLNRLLDFTAPIDWLNSAVCVLVIGDAVSPIAFLWAGLTLYILLHSLITMSRHQRWIVRSLWTSALIQIASIGVVAALPLPPHGPIDVRQVTLGSLIFGGPLIQRLPGFLSGFISMFIGLCVALPSDEDRTPRIAASR